MACSTVACSALRLKRCTTSAVAACTSAGPTAASAAVHALANGSCWDPADAGARGGDSSAGSRGRLRGVRACRAASMDSSVAASGPRNANTCGMRQVSSVPQHGIVTSRANDAQDSGRSEARAQDGTCCLRRRLGGGLQSSWMSNLRMHASPSLRASRRHSRRHAGCKQQQPVHRMHAPRHHLPSLLGPCQVLRATATQGLFRRSPGPRCCGAASSAALEMTHSAFLLYSHERSWPVCSVSDMLGPSAVPKQAVRMRSAGISGMDVPHPMRCRRRELLADVRLKWGMHTDQHEMVHVWRHLLRSPGRAQAASATC